MRSAILFCALVLHAAFPASARETGAFIEVTPTQEKAIDKGLVWLAKQQGNNGSWGANGSGGQYTMAMTGLAGLAFLSAGNSPNKGPHGKNVARAIEFCLKYQNKDGYFSTASDDRSMYGHGFAMMFLAEAYGMDCGTEYHIRIKDALTLAARATLRAQSSRGGWYYSPDSRNDEGSVTITQVQALRAAANCGIPMPEKVLEKAIAYVKLCQNRDGGIRYDANGGGESTLALSAAGAEVFMMAGQYRSKEADAATAYLKKNLNGKSQIGHDVYTHFYGSQAMFHLGGEPFEKYFDDLRTRLLAAQRPDGSWEGEGIGNVYGTAMTVLILTVPYRYLPIYQK